MTLQKEICYKSLSSIVDMIRKLEISPVEVMEAFISRITTRNPTLNAFVYEDFDRAYDESKKSEKELTSGKLIGPLHGIPVAIKDLMSSKPGTIMTMGGIRALKNNVSNHRCLFTERIEKAGGIIIGKTNSPIMGFRGTCDNYLFGPTKNPYCLDKNSGGSSGGSAAAVADGMLPMAEGTDAGGSIRIPASWCGVYGYKASYGRVPNINRPNAFSSNTPFTFSGPITRTVKDAAITLNVLSGYDPRDPFSIDENIDFLDATKSSIRNWKIAYSPNMDVFPVETDVAEKVKNSVLAFEDAGAIVELVKLGIKQNHNELSKLWCQLIIPRNISILEKFKLKGIDLLGQYKDDFPKEYLDWIDFGYKMSSNDYLSYQEIRTNIYDSIQKILNNYNLLVTPTVACLPVQNSLDGNTLGPNEINGEKVDPLIGWCLTSLVNFTGHPAASIPAGFSKEGHPIGMQIIGRRYSDMDVIAASSVFESLHPWYKSYKQCADRPI